MYCVVFYICVDSNAINTTLFSSHFACLRLNDVGSRVSFPRVQFEEVGGMETFFMVNLMLNGEKVSTL